MQLKWHRALLRCWNSESSLLALWFLTRKTPRYWFLRRRSLVVLIPPVTAAQQSLYCCILTFFLWKQSAIFSPSYGGGTKLFLLFWQVLAVGGKFALRVMRVTLGPSSDCQTRRQVIPPRCKGKVGFVCGMRTALLWALKNCENLMLLFSLRVHVLRDALDLKSERGRTFSVSDFIWVKTQCSLHRWQLRVCQVFIVHLLPMVYLRHWKGLLLPVYSYIFLNAEVVNAVAKFSEDACGQR